MTGNSKPVIYINPKEEIRIDSPLWASSHYRIAEKSRDTCKKAENNSSLADETRQTGDTSNS